MVPAEIQSKRFDKGMSGYRVEEVNAYLTEVANYLEDVLDEKAELEQKLLLLAEKVEEYREDEDSLRAALIGAQKLGDSVVREAKRKAEVILADASQKADEMVAQIRENVERETDALNKMQAEVARFKGQILSLYKQHIELINTIPYDERDYPMPTETPKKKKRAEPFAENTASEEGAHEYAFSFAGDADSNEFADDRDESAPKEPRHRDLDKFFGEKSPVTRNE